MLPSVDTAMPWLAALFFALALIHAFSTRFFEQLAQRQPRHAGLWHLLGEVEVVFGLWATALMCLMLALLGQKPTLQYLESRNFTEPLFVLAIMVISGTRPVLALAKTLVLRLASCWPGPQGAAMVFVVLSLVPLLGSLITEPAAMTLAALLLRDTLFAQTASTRVKYASLGVLFVNISIGGTLTPFAAPPVLMVAGVWDWDIGFMLAHFGWKAVLAVLLNALGLTLYLRHDLASHKSDLSKGSLDVPTSMVAVHLLFLMGVVYFAHHPVVFLGLMMLFLGFVAAYPQHQNPLILRESLLVAFFLAGLVVLGGLQQWWLEPLLLGMSPDSVFYGALGLTAITDNAALTYLGSLVPGLSQEFKIALVAGAVTGGGLTLIANAPNPAGAALLKDHFPDQTIEPFRLFVAALVPTAVAMAAFRWL